MLIETSFYIEPSDIGPRKEPVIRYMFKDNYALVKNTEKKWVQYNMQDNMQALPENIDPIDYCYGNDLVPILDKKKMMYGYMSKELKTEIPCIFDKVERFVGKYACVVYKSEDGLIDKEGNLYLSKNILKNKNDVYKNVFQKQDN